MQDLWQRSYIHTERTIHGRERRRYLREKGCGWPAVVGRRVRRRRRQWGREREQSAERRVVLGVGELEHKCVSNWIFFSFVLGFFFYLFIFCPFFPKNIYFIFIYFYFLIFRCNSIAFFLGNSVVGFFCGGK